MKMRDPQSEQRKPLLRDCNKPLVKNDISWTDGKMTPIVILRIQVSLKNFTRNNVLWQKSHNAIENSLLFKRILVMICLSLWTWQKKWPITSWDSSRFPKRKFDNDSKCGETAQTPLARYPSKIAIRTLSKEPPTRNRRKWKPNLENRNRHR